VEFRLLSGLIAYGCPVSRTIGCGANGWNVERAKSGSHGLASAPSSTAIRCPRHGSSIATPTAAKLSRGEPGAGNPHVRVLWGRGVATSPPTRRQFEARIPEFAALIRNTSGDEGLEAFTVSGAQAVLVDALNFYGGGRLCIKSVNCATGYTHSVAIYVRYGNV